MDGGSTLGSGARRVPPPDALVRREQAWSNASYLRAYIHDYVQHCKYKYIVICVKRLWIPWLFLPHSAVAFGAVPD